LTATGDEVFYLTVSGAPAVTTWNGSSWQADTLPGNATSIIGATSNQVFLATGSALALDTASGTTWTYGSLPSAPTTYPGTVLLYAATPTDEATALGAAAYAGLHASQVTSDFQTAWAAALSGNYLVIAVGQAAANALYDNPCGWTNPSQADGGSTPFSYVENPVDVPLTNLFVLATATDPANQASVADDLAYYAFHGALPNSGSTLPALARPGRTCLGSAT
jgi:hypothetical protein